MMYCQSAIVFVVSDYSIEVLLSSNHDIATYIIYKNNG